MKNVINILLFILFCLTALPSMAVQQVDVTVSWETVQAAEKYRVELKDSTGNLIKTEETDLNRYSFLLAPGRYSIRITGINKFHKQEGVSVWKELEVIPKKKKTAAAKPRKPYPGKVYLGAGYSPQLLIGKGWTNILQNSMAGGILHAGFDLSLSSTLRRIPVLRNTGIEFMGQGSIYKGKSTGHVLSSETTQITAAAGLYYRIRTPLYFHILLHGQAGAGLTMIKSKYSVPSEDRTKGSIDSMYRTGISVHIPADFFFVDFGAFYRCIFMETRTMTTVEPFFMAGVKF